MENDSGEKKTGFLDDNFEFENLSEAQLGSFCHAISRYQHINPYKLAVQILGDGASVPIHAKQPKKATIGSADFDLFAAEEKYYFHGVLRPSRSS